MRRLVILLAVVSMTVASCSSGSGDDTGSSSSAVNGESDPDTGADTTQGPAAQDVEFTYPGIRPAAEFPSGLTWFNVERPLSLAQDLRGKVVLLDFWTQGCINCLHVIPDLDRLEEEFGDGLAVIGVHWAKFDSERTDRAVSQAVIRNGVTHPVVNDAANEIAGAYSVSAWPTLVLVDPAGEIVGGWAGEGAYDVFREPIATLLAEWDQAGGLDTEPLGDLLARPAPPPTVLRFPGAVLADEAGGRLFIADSGRDRVLEATLDGALVRSIGTGTPGFTDGPVASAQFSSPQGMSLGEDGNTLYVADRGNHAVRAVDLRSGEVSTVAGTGEQGVALEEGGVATELAVPSPWDVLAVGDSLFVAGAGRHQLYRVGLDDGRLEVFAGTGAEGIDDGPRQESTLSQPSGLASDGTWLWFTDPEASAVRRLPLDGSGELETIVGTGLFDWGDTVGPLEETQLQHVTGIEIVNNYVVVSDTYNHRLKVIDVDGGQSLAWAGTGTSSYADGAGASAGFAEPTGMSATADHLYVADTNNHQIRVIDVATASVSTLELTNLDVATVAARDGEADVVRLAPQQVGPGPVSLEFSYTLPSGYKLNEEGTFTLAWQSGADAVMAPDGSSELAAKAPSLPVVFTATAAPGATTVTAQGTVFYCRSDNEGVCLIRDVEFEVPVEVVAGGPATVAVSHTLPGPAELDLELG
jgi:thiol-disulfide isomerase/thioredoxin